MFFNLFKILKVFIGIQFLISFNEFPFFNASRIDVAEENEDEICVSLYADPVLFNVNGWI